jgi:hypothetical protein
LAAGDGYRACGSSNGIVTRMPKKRRRYARRHGLVGAAARRRRLLILAFVAITLIGGFFAVVAVQLNPAERIYERSVDASFATLVTPIAEQSNDTGSELRSMLGGADSKLSDSSLVATLESMVGAAQSAVEQFELLSPPSNLQGAASLCLAALQGRAHSLGVFRSAVSTLMQGPIADPSGQGQGQGQSISTAGTSQAETSIEQLGSALGASDNSWSQCRHDLLQAPRRGANAVPESEWVGSKDVWRRASLTSFITGLSGSAPRVAGPPLAIVTVAGSPPAVVTVKGADVLPVTTLYSLHVVVADLWSTVERDVVVTVSLRPFGSTGSATKSSAESSIDPGQSVSFHPPALAVSPGATYALEIAVTGPGQQQPAARSYRIAVASAAGLPGP